MKITIKKNLENLQGRPAQVQKKVIQFVANELLRKCDKYIPFDTGMMRDSGISHSVPEYGLLVWATPYVRTQWLYGKSKGLRGKEWALRAWADSKHEIVTNAQRIANGETTS